MAMAHTEDWHDTKITGTILASGFIAGGIVTPGAIYCLEGVAPGLMTYLKRLFAKYVSEPHLEAFEKLSVGLHGAHKRYDEKKRERLVAEGKDPDEAITPQNSTRQERADYIAENMVTTLVALAVDFFATMGLQKVFNYSFGVDERIKPSHIALTENLVSYAGVLAMPAPGVARFSENINHWASRKLRSAFGLEKQRAEDLTVPFTYVGLPGFVGTIAAVIHGNIAGKRAR